MKKLFLVLCAVILVAQPSSLEAGRICVNISEGQKELGMIALSMVFVAGAAVTAIAGAECLLDLSNYIDYKVNNISQEFKKLLTTSVITAGSIALLCGSVKAMMILDQVK